MTLSAAPVTLDNIPDVECCPSCNRQRFEIDVVCFTCHQVLATRHVTDDGSWKEEILYSPPCCPRCKSTQIRKIFHCQNCKKTIHVSDVEIDRLQLKIAALEKELGDMKTAHVSLFEQLRTAKAKLDFLSENGKNLHHIFKDVYSFLRNSSHPWATLDDISVCSPWTKPEIMREVLDFYVHSGVCSQTEHLGRTWWGLALRLQPDMRNVKIDVALGPVTVEVR